MKILTIGKLAVAAGVNLETVRYYERRKLMEPPARSDSGYRQYGVRDLQRLRFIKRAQSLGFTLRDISDLLSLRLDRKTKCGEVRRLAEVKLGNIEQKIRDLRKIKKSLAELLRACNAKTLTNECPILEALDSMEKTHA